MNKTKLYLPLFALFIFVAAQAFNFSGTAPALSELVTDKLIVMQNDTETPLKNYEETIEVERKDFSLRFFANRYNSETKEFHAAQIGAFLDKATLAEIYVGMEKSETPCFTPGTGMAPNISGKYEYIVFANDGHHYTMYEDEESTRLNLIDDSGSLLKLEFEINGIYYDDMQVAMKDTQIKEFYLAVLFS